MVMGNSLYVLYIVHSITFFGLRENDIIYYEISTSWASLEYHYIHTRLCVVGFWSLNVNHMPFDCLLI